MTWDEFWGDFDKADYARSIQCLKEYQLRGEHSRIRAKVVAAKSATAMSTAATLHTFGFSAVGVGVGARKIRYNSQKLKIIEEQMSREGWPIYDMSTGDFLMAAGPAAVAGALGTGAEHLIGHAAGHGAAAFTGHHIPETVQAIQHHSSDFLSAAENGAASQIHAVAHGVTGLGNATQLVPIDAVANNSPSFLGYVAGQGAANAAEIGTLNYAFDKASQAGVRECVTAWRSEGGKPRHGSDESPSIKKSKGRGRPQVVSVHSENYLATKKSNTAQENPKKAKQREQLEKKTGKEQRLQERNDSHKLPKVAQSYTEADTGPFLLLLLPPIIASVAGFTILQFLTLGTVARLVYKKGSIRELDLEWRLLCLSVLYSSIFSHGSLLQLMLITEVWLFLTACLRRDGTIVTPKILAVVALATCMNCQSKEVIQGRIGSLAFGMLSSALIMTVVQYDTGFGSARKRSLARLRWFHWRRPELLLVLSGLICFAPKKTRSMSEGDWVWFAAFLTTAFLSCIQGRARRGGGGV